MMIGPVDLGIFKRKGKVEHITVDMGTAMSELDSINTKADFGQVKLKLNTQFFQLEKGRKMNHEIIDNIFTG